VLRRSSPSAVSTQGVVEREYSAVRRHQPCWDEILVVVNCVGLSVIRLRVVKSSLVVSRLGRSRLFAVRPCHCWSLFVANSRRGAVTTLSVFRRALWSTVSRFQPALVVSRHPKSSVCRRVQSSTDSFPVSCDSCRGQSLPRDESVRLVARPSCSPWRENIIFPL